MGAFDAIDIAQSGADVSQLWLEAIAHNIANVNTIRSADEEPFRAQLVHAEEALNDAGIGVGTRAVQILESDGDPMWVYDPEHPLDGGLAVSMLDKALQGLGQDPLSRSLLPSPSLLGASVPGRRADHGRTLVLLHPIPPGSIERSAA